ncbi:hypothetical protein [Mycobacterium sp. EPa45]|uniref:hypothetical protein n=1 Tax=Mycobacterium sp. EPa45 TaxID=1545728 RepID=UPI000B1E8A23|nr:hypothetical protein [Mycobacterium sp. EPa45]
MVRFLVLLAMTAGFILAPTATASPAGPCEWVTTAEAADILRQPVVATPILDDPASPELSCGYRGTDGGGDGVESDLRSPGAFKVDAMTQFAKAATTDGATEVGGLGLKAVCIYEPTTTPPSSTVVVQLSGDRLYRATGWYAKSCDTLARFARLAIGRIGQ